MFLIKYDKMLSFIEVYYDKMYYLDCLVQGVRQKL